MAKLKKIEEVKKKKKNQTASKPPHAPLPGTRWVRGSDGKWMMHETNDPDRGIRGLHIRRASNKSNKKSKTG